MCCFQTICICRLILPIKNDSSWWSQKWASVLSYGVSETDLDDTTLPANTYARADYITANLIWLPVERMGVGLEYMFGSRENRDGQTGEANRIQMAFQYKF